MKLSSMELNISVVAGPLVVLIKVLVILVVILVLMLEIVFTVVLVIFGLFPALSLIPVLI